MNARPKVSVGIPVYNAEKFLRETIDSLMVQTFPDFEIIISDNASIDETEEICRSYADQDQRVRYHRNENNIGIVPNFNRLFGISRGEYFKWVAADDIMAPEYLARCVDVLDQDSTVVLAAPRVKLIEADGSPVRFDSKSKTFITTYGEQIPAPSPIQGLASPKASTRFRAAALSLGGSHHAQFVYGLVRSDALAETPLIEGYPGAERVMLARLSLMGRLQEIPEQLFFRRHHPDHFGSLSPRETAKEMNPERSIILFPMGRYIPGYLSAVAAADLSRLDKMVCSLALVEKLARVASSRARHKLRKTFS
jgi:glycosyltransferase involved in cell wall biosynthesis